MCKTDASDGSLYPTGDVSLIRYGCLCCPSVACDSGMAAHLHCPLAKRFISGLVSSTLLTLVVLPALYTLLAPGAAARDVSRTRCGASL